MQVIQTWLRATVRVLPGENINNSDLEMYIDELTLTSTNWLLELNSDLLTLFNGHELTWTNNDS